MSKVKNILLWLIPILLLFTGCTSKSKRRLQERENNKGKTVNKQQKNKKIIIKMTSRDGVYTIPVKVNGIDLEFIFDTGASNVSISETEATFLVKQGRLKEEDMRGKQKFIDANGDVSEGRMVNLSEVQIGDRKLNNVEASIVNNQVAPLLLGQSLLERFGKVIVDNKKKEIIFE